MIKKIIAHVHFQTFSAYTINESRSNPDFEKLISNP